MVDEGMKARLAGFRTIRLPVARGITLEASESRQRPAAPAVVLLHGIGQTRYSWATAGARLASVGYHVVLYDARGHGASDWAPDGDYSISRLADDLEEVIAYCDGPVGLVGASMGGMTAFLAAGRTPEQVAALILVDVVPSPNSAGAERVRAFMGAHPEGFADVEEAVEAVGAYNPGRPRPTDPSGLMRNLRRGSDGRLHWHWDPRLMTAEPLAEPLSFLSHARRISDRIVAPTLLVRGMASDVIDDEGVEQLQRMVPQTEIAEVAGAGHMVSGDRNDAFDAASLSFLKRYLPLVGKAGRD